MNIDMTTKENNINTYYIEVKGAREYFQYDEALQVCTRGDRKITIFRETLEDFLHVATTLGLNAGKL